MQFVPCFKFGLLLTIFVISHANGRSVNNRGEEARKKGKYGILGGQQTTISKYPHMVSITYIPDNFIIGAGSILNKNWIICSAYEIKGYPLEDMTIRAGSSRVDRGGQLLNVSETVVYSKFYGGYPDDFALVKTATPILFGEHAKSIKLSETTPAVGTQVQVVGFGLTSRKNQSDYNLRVATVQVKSKEECSSQHGDLGDTCLCADADGVGPCYADMGAALVYKKQLLGYYLGGDGCNYYNILEIYANVVPVRQWILETIKDNN